MDSGFLDEMARFAGYQGRNANEVDDLRRRYGVSEGCLLRAEGICNFNTIRGCLFKNKYVSGAETGQGLTRWQD